MKEILNLLILGTAYSKVFINPNVVIKPKYPSGMETTIIKLYNTIVEIIFKFPFLKSQIQMDHQLM